jgi:hypothetical protein
MQQAKVAGEAKTAGVGHPVAVDDKGLGAGFFGQPQQRCRYRRRDGRS